MYGAGYILPILSFTLAFATMVFSLYEIEEGYEVAKWSLAFMLGVNAAVFLG